MTRLFPPLAHVSIPNLMTTGSILLGAATLWLAAQGRVEAAAILYLAVLVSDRLDGIVARRLGQTSEFGKQIDSLADLLNFCALPALACWVLGLRAPLQLAAAALFVVAGAWRLAYFNVNDLEIVRGRPCFVGVCTTHAAAVLLAACSLAAAAGLDLRVVAPAIMAALAALMLSGLRVPKNGAFTVSLYVIVPLSVGAMIWLR